LEVLEELFRKTTVDSIALSGGEITLVMDLERIVKFLGQKSVPVVLTTNGTLLDRKRVKTLKESGISTFQIPILAGNKTIHDNLTGVPSWEKAIRSLVYIKDEGGQAAIVFVATRANLQYFIEVLEVAALLGIDRVIFNKFVGAAGAGLINRGRLHIDDVDELVHVLKDANDFARMHSLKIELGTPITLSPTEVNQLDCVSWHKCPVGLDQSRFVLDGFGNLRACPQSKHILGNIMDQHPDDILHSAPEIALFQDHPATECRCLAMG